MKLKNIPSDCPHEVQKINNAIIMLTHMAMEARRTKKPLPKSYTESFLEKLKFYIHER